MNLLLGCCGPIRGDVTRRFAAHALGAYGAAPTHTPVGSTDYTQSVLLDGGPLSTNYSKDGIYLLGMGRFHGLGGGTSPGGALADRYRRSGLGFLDGVDGHYAVALYDSERQRLLLAADPARLRTLFYYAPSDGRTFAFASNLRALAVATGAVATLDRSLEDFLLIYGFLPDNRTPYQDVYAIPPATLIEWHAGTKTDHAIASRPSSTAPAFGDLREDGVADALYERMLVAVGEQSGDTDDAAVLLGGFDSALVAALLARMGKRVTTYSFCYGDARFDQPHTDTLARHIGSRHQWINIDADVIRRGLQSYSTVFNQPTNWPNYVIQTDHVCRHARAAGFRFCYTGDGCDGIFMGYPSVFKRTRLIHGAWRIPEWLAHLLLRFFGRRTLELYAGQTYRIAFNLLRILARRMPERGHLTFRIFDETSLARLREAPPPHQQAQIERLLSELAAGFGDISPLRLAYLGKSAVSPNRAKIVGSEDHNGVVIQSPYLHADVRAFAGALPDRLLRPEGSPAGSDIGKHVLAAMALRHKLLPAEVIYQPKLAAITSPIDKWYAGDLRTTVTDLLDGLPFTIPARYRGSLLEDLAAERFYKRYLSNDQVLSHAISLLVTYAAFTAPAPEAAT